MSSTREIGKRGEQLAADWLEQHGYVIVEKNYFARVGEIDIIARYGETGRLCFVEVKTRARRDGSALHAHSARKHAKIRAAAQKYCLERQILVDKTDISFEHISVHGEGEVVSIDHYVVDYP